MVVSQFADGVLLIARSGATTKDQAAAARTACTKAGATVFGAALNATPITEGDQPAYYAYYGEDGTPTPDYGRAGLNLVVGNNGSNLSNSYRGEDSRAARHHRGRSGGR
jgi:Mrp family chromosome partitioning ATPase